jgi:hypothetical protein
MLENLSLRYDPIQHMRVSNGGVRMPEDPSSLQDMYESGLESFAYAGDEQTTPALKALLQIVTANYNQTLVVKQKLAEIQQYGLKLNQFA